MVISGKNFDEYNDTYARTGTTLSERFGESV